MNDKDVKVLFSALSFFANLSPKKAKQVYMGVSIGVVALLVCVEQIKRKKHQEHVDKMEANKQKYEHEERMAMIEIEKIRVKGEVNE